MKKLTKKMLHKKLGDVVEENIAKLLDEEYFKSYPTETVKNLLNKKLKQISNELKISFIFKLNTADEMDDKDPFNDLQVIYLQISDFPDNLKKRMEDILDQYGWYIGDIEYNDVNLKNQLDKYIIYIEPKFPIENSKINEISKQWIEKHKIFYHISFKKYEKKILENGLVPSLSKRGEYEHPERIYLFGDKAIAKDFVIFHKTSKIKYAKEIGRRKIRNTNIDADERYQDSSMSDIVGFEIDLFQMMKDGKTINLYHDNRWNNEDPVYFTQNTINPKYIKLFYP